MKALYYIKTTLKSMVANLVVTVAYFILFPVLVACVMAFFQDSSHDNPLKLNPLKLQIEDKDNSKLSKQLVKALNSKEFSDIVIIVDKDPEAELIIEKGYEDKVLAKTPGNIIINKKVSERQLTTDTVRSVLDRYHKQMYISVSGGDVEKFNSLIDNSVIKSTTIDVKDTSNIYETLASSMIGFLIAMLMYSIIQSGYQDISMNLDKRILSLPLTKLQALFYDTIALFIYVFIIISCYVLTFRIAGLGFRGSLLGLFVLVFTGSIIVISIGKTISVVFGPKLGKIVGIIMYLIPLASAEFFLAQGNKLSLISPTHYLNNAFKLYNLNGSLEGCGKWIIPLIIFSIGIYLFAIIKTVLDRRGKVCV